MDENELEGIAVTEVVTVMSRAEYEVNGSVKEPNKFHNYETEIITREASDAAEYIELFGSSTRDRHTRCISCYSLNVHQYMCRRA